MKSQQYQDIDSFGVISVFLVIGLCIMVSAPVWNGSQSEDFEKTMHRAENLAYQIVEARSQVESGKLGPDRIPAAETLSRLRAEAGEIGTDLWGHPFRFRVLQSSQHQTRVLVWSSGPNGKADTLERPDPSQEGLGQTFGASEFAGDDVGIIITIK